MFIPLPDISSLQGRHLVCGNCGCKAEFIFLATDNRIGTRRCACGGILISLLESNVRKAASALSALQSDSE
jgi:hypothetical protein